MLISEELEKIVEINDYVVVDLTEVKSNVTYRYLYQIVDDYDFDIGNKINKVSTISPLGSRIILAKIGDSGKYNVHEYHYKYQIIDILKNNEKEIKKVKTRKK